MDIQVFLFTETIYECVILDKVLFISVNVGFDIIEEFKLVPGLQLYVYDVIGLYPSVVLSPEQMVLFTAKFLRANVIGN